MREKPHKHIVVLRFSALGDAAIASPLLKAYATSNSDTTFTMVSHPMLRPLFTGCDNLKFIAADFRGEHKGFLGILKLYRDIMRVHPTAIADINSVLRTFILRALFLLSMVPFAYLRKGRREKQELTRRKNKKLRELKSTMRRYEEVLISLELKDIGFSRATLSNSESPGAVMASNGANFEHSWEKIVVGVAPFANNRGKIWPLDLMEQLIAKLSSNGNFKVTLFGGGKNEATTLKGWEIKYANVKSVAGDISFEQELDLMSRLDLMICMDSANMHFASCVGIPVLSFWGATHPYIGFYGWGQKLTMALQSSVECRPCSTSGKKECFRGDYLCLYSITPEEAERRVLGFFKERLELLNRKVED
jgi:ADP-heptose:LPS heptosyltransferase